MVELLVAMAIGLLVTLAAVSALTVTRRGHNTVDAASQLEDNIRFATDLIQRVGVQAGYMNSFEAGKPQPPNTQGVDSSPDPNITGFNNSTIDKLDPINTPITRATNTDVGYGSDILILQYQTEPSFPGSTQSDKSMIDCAGNTPTNVPSNRYDRVINILHVGIIEGEPTLICNSSPNGIKKPQHLITGVENFQVLYGTRGVIPGVAPAPLSAGSDTASERYLRADQMLVTGDPEATKNNWRRVSSIRIGMVVRGPVNSQQDQTGDKFYPFGSATAKLTNISLDPGTEFTPSADGRLRQAATFTIHLRNHQDL